MYPPKNYYCHRGWGTSQVRCFVCEDEAGNIWKPETISLECIRPFYAYRDHEGFFSNLFETINDWVTSLVDSVGSKFPNDGI